MRRAPAASDGIRAVIRFCHRLMFCIPIAIRGAFFTLSCCRHALTSYAVPDSYILFYYCTGFTED